MGHKEGEFNVNMLGEGIRKGFTEEEDLEQSLECQGHTCAPMGTIILIIDLFTPQILPFIFRSLYC